MSTIEHKRPADVAAIRKAEAIQMRIAGHSQQAVADKLGVTQQRVSLIELEWLASQKPSSEVTEQRRQQQLAGIDQVRARLFDSLDDGLELGERLGVVDRLGKLWDREARLLGLDLQQNVSVLAVTREALAEALGRDAPIDVEAVEITEESGDAE